MAFSNEDKLVFEKIFFLKEKKRFNECLAILNVLKKKYKNNSAIYGLMGTIYFQSRDYKGSARYFRKILALKPKSELASLGLFHSLIHLGKTRLALNEMARFLSLKRPKLYKGTIKELHKNVNAFESKKDIELIKQLYIKWGRTRRIPDVAMIFQLPINVR